MHKGMLRNRAGVVAVLVIALFAATAQSAGAALPPRPDQALKTIVSATGSSAHDLAVPEIEGKGLTARVARSSSGSPLRTLVQPKTDGAAIMAVLDEPGTATFIGLVPDGSTIAPVNGLYAVHVPDGTNLTIAAPWARDATGRSLSTHYTFNGTTITQVVDTTGATFPVVADPSFTWGFLAIFAHLNRNDVFWSYHHASYYEMGAAACLLFGYVPVVGLLLQVACGAMAFYMKVNLGEGIYAAAHHYTGTWGACLTATFVQVLLTPVYVYQNYNLQYC